MAAKQPVFGYDRRVRSSEVPFHLRDHISQVAATAKEHNMSYGQWQGLLYERSQESEQERLRQYLEHLKRQREKRIKSGWRFCPVCGILFKPAQGQQACSTECRRKVKELEDGSDT